MQVDTKTRVVLLLTGQADVIRSVSSSLPQNAAIRHTQSQYTVAGEIISGSVAMLALDLRYLQPGHLGLVDLCRQNDLDLLVFGTPQAGVSQHDLGGARITTPANIARDINKFLTTAPDRLGETPQQPETIEQIQSEGHEALDTKQPDRQPVIESVKPVETLDTSFTSPVPVLGDLLTQDEISALLEEGL